MKSVKVIFLFFMTTHLALGQSQAKSLTKRDTIVKTSNFKFERNYFDRWQGSSGSASKKRPQKSASFDLSFLKNYEFKTYSMGDFYVNNSLICMPFREWGTDVIPHHLKQQTFTVLRKKKDRKR